MIRRLLKKDYYNDFFTKKGKLICNFDFIQVIVHNLFLLSIILYWLV